MAAIGAACSRETGPDTPPSPSASSATPSLPQRDFTAPGEATAVVKELVAAAGTIHAIKVEITRRQASLSVVSGMRATTWAWRDGRVAVVDSDTEYVGQAIFDPRDFNVADLAGMFAVAETAARSSAGQMLQIVEYADRAVYMTVTTNPESQTVFFTRDGAVVPQVDVSTAAGLTAALGEVIGTKSTVLALGVLPNQGGVWVDTSAGDTLVRTLRRSRFPVRLATRRESSTLLPFDPRVVAPSVVLATLERLSARLKGTPGPGWGVTVDARDASGEPRMYWSLGNQQAVTTLTGVNITPR